MFSELAMNIAVANNTSMAKFTQLHTTAAVDGCAAWTNPVSINDVQQKATIDAAAIIFVKVCGRGRRMQMRKRSGLLGG